MDSSAFGELLSTVATVNDLHFGETVCGVLAGLDLGPPLHAEPDEEPYPLVMNRAAIAEILELSPDAVVVKGDITSDGTAQEFAAFDAMYRGAFGDRLIVTLGNHDKSTTNNAAPAVPPFQSVELEGVLIAVLDTARPGEAGGKLSDSQTDELDQMSSRADRPVLVYGHHPVGGDDIYDLFGPSPFYGNSLDPNSTEKLVSVVSRRPAICGYFAGHTHRNKVRHLDATAAFPWVEVACVKDFPGTWAEYRCYERGIVQIHHRINSSPAALRWSERCRSMFGGRYPAYSLGEERDRSFEIPVRATPGRSSREGVSSDPTAG